MAMRVIPTISQSLFYGTLVAGPTGLEPATSGLTGQRSNRAELRPHDWIVDLRLQINKAFNSKFRNPKSEIDVVGGTGFEPVTSCL